MWTYRAKDVRVVDGDTIQATVDLGFNIHHRIFVRLVGVNTPELRGGTQASKAEAKVAKEFVQDWVNWATANTLEVGELWPITITTGKGRSFNRWVGTVRQSHPNPEPAPSLNDMLRTEGWGA